MNDAHRRMRLAFLAPMPPELRPLKTMLSLQKQTAGGTTLHTGTLGQADVVAMVTGIGTERAAHATEHILDTGPFDHLLVIGVAGSVSRDLDIGDVVVPDVVIDAATGTEHRPTPLGATTTGGRILTTDDFTKNPDILSSWTARGITAVDMETSAIADVCEQRGCPWSAFRGISDDAFDPLVDEAVLGLTRPDGSANLAAVARYVLTKPTRVGLLSRLARDLKAATTAAVVAAVRSCR